MPCKHSALDIFFDESVLRGGELVRRADTKTRVSVTFEHKGLGFELTTVQIDNDQSWTTAPKDRRMLRLMMPPDEEAAEEVLETVWLAAMWEKKVTKAQVIETDIGTASQVIPGLGLRVAGKLLVGLGRLFRRKATYLAADCAEAVVSLRVAFRASELTEAVGKKIIVANFDDVDPDLDLDVPVGTSRKKRALTWTDDWAEASAHLAPESRRESYASSIEMPRGRSRQQSLGGFSDVMDDLDPVLPDDLGQFLPQRTKPPSLGPIIDDADDFPDDDDFAHESPSSDAKKQRTEASPLDHDDVPPPPPPMDDDDDFDLPPPPPPMDDDDEDMEPPPPIHPADDESHPADDESPPRPEAEEEREDEVAREEPKKKKPKRNPSDQDQKRKLHVDEATQLEKRTVKAWLANTKPILAEEEEPVQATTKHLRPLDPNLPDLDGFTLNAAGEAAAQKVTPQPATPESSTVSSVENFRFQQPTPDDDAPPPPPQDDYDDIPMPPPPMDDDDDDDDLPVPPQQEPRRSLGIIDDMDMMNDDDLIGAFSPGTDDGTEQRRPSHQLPPSPVVEREWHPNTVKVATMLKASLPDGGTLSFDDITADADKQTTVGIFVELLHLKAWDFINLHQGRPPKGDISITPAASFDEPIPSGSFDGGGSHGHPDDDDDDDSAAE